MAFNPSKDRGFEVRYDNDLFANQGGGFVSLSNPGDDLTCLRPKVDAQDEQAIGIRVKFGADDGANAQVNPLEVLKARHSRYRRQSGWRRRRLRGRRLIVHSNTGAS